MNYKHLIPDSLQTEFEKQGYMGDKKTNEIKVICKLFNPCGAGTWWLYEHIEEDIYIAFCLLDDPSYAELGTISLNELASVKLPFGLRIERDLYFESGNKSLLEIIHQIKGK